MESLGNFFLGLGVFIGSLVQLLNYLNGKTNAENIAHLTRNTNSIKDALLKVTGESERAKGVLEGKAELGKG